MLVTYYYPFYKPTCDRSKKYLPFSGFFFLIMRACHTLTFACPSSLLHSAKVHNIIPLIDLTLLQPDVQCLSVCDSATTFPALTVSQAPPPPYLYSSLSPLSPSLIHSHPPSLSLPSLPPSLSLSTSLSLALCPSFPPPLSPTPSLHPLSLPPSSPPFSSSPPLSSLSLSSCISLALCPTSFPPYPHSLSLPLSLLLSVPPPSLPSSLPPSLSPFLSLSLSLSLSLYLSLSLDICPTSFPPSHHSLPSSLPPLSLSLCLFYLSFSFFSVLLSPSPSLPSPPLLHSPLLSSPLPSPPLLHPPPAIMIDLLWSQPSN